MSSVRILLAVNSLPILLGLVNSGLCSVPFTSSSARHSPRVHHRSLIAIASFAPFFPEATLLACSLASVPYKRRVALYWTAEQESLFNPLISRVVQHIFAPFALFGHQNGSDFCMALFSHANGTFGSRKRPLLANTYSKQTYYCVRDPIPSSGSRSVGGRA